MELTKIQSEIVQALKQNLTKETFTESALVKKIRENTKYQGKKKGSLAVEDIIVACKILSNENIFFSIHINSANDILIKKETNYLEITTEAKQRRLKSEKSMTLITSRDITDGEKNLTKDNKKKKKNINRTERLSLSIYEDYE